MSAKLLVFVFSLLFTLFIIPPFASASSVTDRKIVIDPGHGGSDSGSTACAGYPEKNATLDIGTILLTLLNNDGANASLTRTNDTDWSNADRYNFANSYGGEVLVSIHLNGANNANKNGTMGLYGRRNKDLSFTKVLHDRLYRDLGLTSLPVPDLGITNFASGVLLKSNVPAAIQETVFISNTKECQLLTNGQSRQKEIAKSLYNGLVDWFGR